MSASTRPDAITAWHTLAGGLDDLARAGRLVPCQVDPGPFTSEELRERREAARACAGCPLIDACRAFAEANREVWHVWGGRDRRARVGRRAATGGGGGRGCDRH